MAQTDQTEDTDAESEETDSEEHPYAATADARWPSAVEVIVVGEDIGHINTDDGGK